MTRHYVSLSQHCYQAAFSCSSRALFCFAIRASLPVACAHAQPDLRTLLPTLEQARSPLPRLISISISPYVFVFAPFSGPLILSFASPDQLSLFHRSASPFVSRWPANILQRCPYWKPENRAAHSGVPLCTTADALTLATVAYTRVGRGLLSFVLRRGSLSNSLLVHRELDCVHRTVTKKQKHANEFEHRKGSWTSGQRAAAAAVVASWRYGAQPCACKCVLPHDFVLR